MKATGVEGVGKKRLEPYDFLTKQSPMVRVKKVIKSGDHPRIYIARPLIDKTVKSLRKQGVKFNEGLVFWAGIEAKDGSKFVTTCVYPKQQCSGISVSSNLIAGAKVVREIRKRGLEIIAEIHSHPGQWVGHSLIDDENPFVLAEGNISIVVPYFARKGMEPLWKCGVHIYSFRGGWKRLGRDEIAETFVILDQEITLEGEPV